MKTLILNADYTPLSIINIRRAIVLDLNNTNISVLSYYKKRLCSSSGEVKIPAVMVYSKYIRISYKKFPSKRAIRTRDRSKCGYCNKELHTEELTIDHIIPVSRFKQKSQANTWENQVSCCRKCNLSKGNRTPQEAGMNLLITPKKAELLLVVENVPEEWLDYI